MDATARGSFCSVRTLFALTVLLSLCIFCVAASSGSPQDLSIVHYRRLVARQSNGFSGSSTTTTEVPTSSTPSPISQSGTSSVFATSVTSIPSSSGSPTARRILRSTSASAITSVQLINEVTSSSATIVSQSLSQSSARPTESTPLITTISSTTTSNTIVPLSASSEATQPTSKTLNVVPVTTFELTNGVQPPSTIQTPTITQGSSSSTATITSIPVSAASNSSGFWKNKSAVAATFVIVSLVFGGILIVAIIAILKRRSMREQQQLHEDLFEKYTEPDRSNSPSPSINAPPLDAFAAASYGNGVPPSSYGIAESQRIFHSSTPVQHPDFWDEQTAPSQYTSPSKILATSSAVPPTAFRNTIARDSYQQSIDSFYGAAGQPSSGYQ